MVEEHADPAVRPGLELVEHRAQVVGAVETLDDHTFDAQVVAPDLLDQLGVVHAFDQDPRRARDPGACADDGAAARTRCARSWTRVRERGVPVAGSCVAGATSRTAVPSTANAPAWFGNRRSSPVWPRSTTSFPSSATNAPAKPDDRCRTRRPGRAGSAG